MSEKIFLVQETMDFQNFMVGDQVFQDIALEIRFLITLDQMFEESKL